MRPKGVGVISTKVGRGAFWDATTYQPERRLMRLYTEAWLRQAIVAAGLKIHACETSNGWVRIIFRRS